MKHLKRLFYFLKKLARETLVNFMETLTLEQSENGLQPSLSRKLSPQEKDTIRNLKNIAQQVLDSQQETTWREEEKNPPQELLKDLFLIEDSNYQVDYTGDLVHKNYDRQITGLMPHGLNLGENVPYELTLAFTYE